MTKTKAIGLASAFFVFAVSCLLAPCSAQTQAGWTVYNGGAEGDHYSTLKQIDRENVQQLQQAWRYDTGDAGGLQANPLIVGRTLYAYTHTQQVIALDAATGQLKWKFDAGIHGTQPQRGVAYWTDGRHGRILAGVMNFLYCLDAETGKPIASFGENGRIDLRKGLRGDYTKQSIVLTTPGIVYKNLIIVGGRNPETHPAPPGDIRAFDVRTGRLRWRFHTIPRPGEPGYKTWPAGAWQTAGAANNWAGMVVDVKRGIVYAPTGSAVMDFYGGDRVGNDLYANTILALDASTGKMLWHFQGVHHDLWDRDFPSPPALFTIERNGKTIDALAQTTKQGYLYLFNRVTGQPLYPIHEHAYAASTVPGEAASPTQPMPDWPEPYARQHLTEDMLTTRTPEAHAWALQALRSYRNGGPFYPFAIDQQTIVFPGFDGGAEWGGPAIDPTTHILYLDATEMAYTGGLTVAKQTHDAGASVYQQQCTVCHGTDLTGAPPAFPSLVGAGKRLGDAKMIHAIQMGTGRMPGFPSIQGADLKALLDYLRDYTPAQPESKKEMSSSIKEATALDRGKAGAPQDGQQKYVFTGYKKFLDPDGYPAIAPPWGTLNAIDLTTGKYLWKVPLGEYPELAKQGMTNTGSEVYGGPVVTAGGVLFIGATVYDRKFHAFDSQTGKLLWETELPFAGVATPSTYMIDGRQYVVIAASSGRDPKCPPGAAYVAFALPE